jgi:hypothetical protein
VDNQKFDASKVKTHEEIMKLFEDVLSAEARVKNPEKIPKTPYGHMTILRQVEPLRNQPQKPFEQKPPIQPAREIPSPKQEQQKKPFVKREQQPQIVSEKKKRWFDFLKIEVTEDEELTPTPEIEPEPEDFTIKPSTFVLQLDDTRNLVGFPLKKTLESQQSGQTEEPTGELEKGIKGLLKRLGSKLGRKKSPESESSGGIGGKILGIFRRKNKE